MKINSALFSGINLRIHLICSALLLVFRPFSYQDCKKALFLVKACYEGLNLVLLMLKK